MKKKLSRLLCALLVMTMVLAMVPAVSAADKEIAKTATLLSTFETTISGCTSKNHTDSKNPAKDYTYKIDGVDYSSTTSKYLEKVSTSAGKTTWKVKAVNTAKDSGEDTVKLVATCPTCQKTATYNVTVKYAEIKSFVLDTDKTTLTITKNAAEMPVDGDESKATVFVKPLDTNKKEDTVNQKVQWRSSNSLAVKVTADSVDTRKATLQVTGKAGAKATITAIPEGSSTLSYSFTVTVTDNNLTLSLDKDEMSMEVDKEASVKATMGGPLKDSRCYISWYPAKNDLTDAQRHKDLQRLINDNTVKVTDVAELTGDLNGTFKALKTGDFYLLAQAYTRDGRKYSDIQVCHVYVKDGSYEIKIEPTQAVASTDNASTVETEKKAGKYNPKDENSKFYTGEEYADKDRLALTAWLKSASMSAEAKIAATWTVEDSGIVAFENTDSSIRTKTVSTIKNQETVNIRAMGKGKTTVTAETKEGKATFTITVWDSIKLIAPSTTPYDYTNEITVSSDNPLASMQAKKPTFSVDVMTSAGKRGMSVPVEWQGREIDTKNGTVKFNGVLKLNQNENYTVYQLGTLNFNGVWTESKTANTTVYAITKISDSASSIKITTQPQSASYNVGKKVEALKVVATGSSNLTYQWYDGDTNKPISGATKATYTPSISKSGTFKYYCIVSAGSEYVISDTAVIKVSGEYRVELSNSSGSAVGNPTAVVGSGTTYSVDVQKWDYDSGKYGTAGSCTVTWDVTKNSEYGSVSSTSSSVTFTGKAAKAASKGYNAMVVTATIKKNGTEVGTDEISVTVNPAEASTVKQSVGSGAALKASSITSAVTKAAGSNAKLSYIIFNTPKSCTLQKSSSSSSSIGDTKCYVSTTSGQKLSDVYVKTSASSASVTYTAYDADDYVLATGTVSFDANDSGDTITASGASLKTIGAADQITGEYAKADYVKFDLPRASEGKLYYDYTTISDFGGEVKDSDKYYLDASSSQNDIEDVYFLPAAGVTGKFKIDYTAYSSSNSDLGSGTITVNIKSKTSSDKFTDVSTKTGFQWAADSIDFGADNGIIKGATTYTFAPSQSLTRAQLVTILYRAAGSPSVSGVTNPFKDTKSDYYTNAMLWAYKNSIVTGTSATTFSPDSPVTREQIAAILYRYMGSPTATGSLTGFTDRANVSTYATTAMQWAIGKGYITGIGTKLDPKGNATRAQVAVIIHRFLTK